MTTFTYVGSDEGGRRIIHGANYPAAYPPIVPLGGELMIRCPTYLHKGKDNRVEMNADLRGHYDTFSQVLLGETEASSRC